MSDQVIGVTIKGIGDFSDVVSNVGNVQKALTKLKLPDKLGDNLNKNISSFMREYDKYQKKIAEGIHTQGDQNAVNKSLNSMLNSYEKIIKDFSKISPKDFKEAFNLDDSAFTKVQTRIKEIQAEIKKIKLDPKQLTEPINEISKLTKANSLFGSGKAFDKLKTAFATNEIEDAKEAIADIQTYYDRFSAKMSENKRIAFLAEFDKLKAYVNNADEATKKWSGNLDQLEKELSDIGGSGLKELDDIKSKLNEGAKAAESVTEALKRQHAEEFSFNREAQNIDRQIQSYFGLSQMIRKVGDIAKDAFSTVKELDKAMTETAVVTNFNVGDMWDMLPTYTAQANQLGSTIRDVYEAATLYYQQGLNTNQAMSLANETLKMARIAGLDAAEATNMMTAALRGFNMEINQQSAQKINDIYSELAAITASDTKEIGSAMERTASIANSANMEFATTSAFLAQMIETTREAPENLGTAMKTIVARFQEMKQDPTKLVDSEGVAMDANKVDKALKTIGVNLMNTKGEFRDLDDVFLDISQRWDSLTQGQQRYIATIAAGSRQQSRFIAMMSNYERTMELVDAANNSAGASQRQFEKTLDSMEAKLNKLKNAWDQFTMGLMNNQILKFGVDALTEGFTIVNKFIDILGKIPPKPFEGITKSILTLVTTLGMLNLGKKGARGLVMGGAAWWKGEEGGFGKNFMSGFSGKAAKAGTTDGQIYAQNFNNAIKKGQLKDALNLTKNRAKILSAPIEYENTFQGAFGQFSAKELSMGWSSQIEAEIRDAFTRASASVNASIWGEEDGNEYIEGLITKMRSGEISAAEAANSLHLRTQGQANITDIGVNALPTKEVDQLSNSLTKAGSSLQSFGLALQDTPLAPFGAMLSKIGMLTSSFGESAGKAMTIFKNGMKGTAVAEAEVGAGATAMAAGEATATTATTGLIGGIQALWAALLESPLFPIIAALAGLVIAYKLLDAAIITNKEQLEAATDAAAAASEAYDSAKQETSELADAIEQVKANEDAFDGLVVGTAAFNEQLVTANDQIMELIKKYPMLNDYLTTDKNGLMHISDEGLNAVKDYQKQLQANASALNLIQTADLNSVEAKQKADQMRKTKGTDTLESLAQRRQEADLVEQQAEAQQQMAKLNAVNTALVDKEIGNREKVSAILADQYDARREAISLEGESIHDLKQEYADFYGYKYDKSTKKITDIEGNEIDVDNATIKDAVKDIRVLTDIEVNAGSVDTAISSIDRKFSEHFKGDNNFFSDILSDNINTNEDLLREALQNPDKIKEAVSDLSSKEMAAILGVSADAIEADPNKYSKDLISQLTEKAENIAESQSEAWGEFGAMLAQAEGKNADAILRVGSSATNIIQNQLTQYTAEQRDLMLSIGKSLESSAGTESMKSFIQNASEIYRSGAEDTVNELNGIIEEVNWDSPTARLKAYKDLTSSTTPEIQKMGQELLDSTESANLLGEAFEEFYNSNDWAELSENMDSFVDASGKLNASAVEDMAEQCNSLNNLLDTGAISAGGVAAAINALGSDGELTLLDLNSNVLKLLSDFNQLDDAISSAHRSIENFDWGMDTGEAEDFVKDSAKKWNELYDNWEFGNPQLEAYAKYVLGEEKYLQILKDNSGDLRDTMNDVAKYVNRYADGFDKAWNAMATDNTTDTINGKKISMYYGENGDIIWDPGEATTNELIQWLEKVQGISEDMAKVMLEDWENYSPEFKAERQKNDFEAGLKEGGYVDEHRNAQGGITITASELETIAAATGQDTEAVKQAIADAAKIETDQLNVLNNIGANTDKFSTLNDAYNLSETGSANKSWISDLVTEVNGKSQVQANDAISKAINDGFTQTQAEGMAYEELSKAVAEGTDVWYKDKLLTPEDLASFDNFKTAIQEFEDNAQWVKVGEAIAQGVISYLKGGKDSPKESNKGKKPSNKKDDSVSADPNPYTAEQEELYSRGTKKIKEGLHNFWQGLKDAVSSAEPAEDPKVAAKEKAQQDYQEWAKGLNEAAKTQKMTGGVDPEVQANIQAKMKSMWDAVKKAFSSGASSGDSQVSVKTPKAQAQTTTVNYTKGTQESASKQTAVVDYKLGKQDKPKTPQEAKVNYTLGSQVGPSAKTVDISPHFVGTWEKTITLKPAARGMNNNIPYSHLPQFGSAAKGRYGTVGPKNKGGLTLTGEEGFEIAWLPGENRSMIVGAGGPQMLNLPADAVVYTHEQSKEILKRKGIPAGSHSSRPQKTVTTSSGGGGGGGKGNGQHTTPQVDKVSEVIIKTSGKVFSWWEKISRQVKAVEKEAKKLGDQTTKVFNDLRASIADVNEVNKEFIKAQQNTIKLNQDIINNSNKKLNTLDTGTSNDKYIKAKSAKEKADKKVASAKKAYKKNKSKKNKRALEKAEQKQKEAKKDLNEVTPKDVKQAKKEYNKAQKAYKKKKSKKNKTALNKAKEKYEKADTKAAKKGTNWETVEWEQTKKTTKKGKTKKTKVTKKESIDLSQYIKKDKDGNYYVDKAKIDALGKQNKAKAKAVQKAAYEQIDKYQDRKDEAEENITSAQDQLADYRKQIDDTFFGWKNELTQVLRISSEIERTEARINDLKARQERTQFYLDNLDLSKGAEGTNGDLKTYFNELGEQTKKNIELNNDENKSRYEKIEANKKEMASMGELTNKTVSYEDINGEVQKESENDMYKRISNIIENGTGLGWDELSTQEKKIFARQEAFQRKIIVGNPEDGYSLNEGKEGKGGLVDYLAAIGNGEIQEELGSLLQEVWDDVNEKTLENIDLQTEIYSTETDNLKLYKDYQDTAKQISEQLYGWKNTLTKVLELTNKIEQSEKRLNYLKTADELFNKQMLSGESVSTADILATYVGQMIEVVSEVENLGSKLGEQRADLQSYLTGDDIYRQINNLSAEAPTEANIARLEELQKQLEIRKLALDYGTITQNADGTISATYDSAKIEKDLGSKFDAETAKEIEQFYQDLNEMSGDIRDTMQSSLDKISELQQSLIDLRQSYADSAEKLLNAYVNQQQKIIDNIKALYSSIDSHFKELISDTKQTLQLTRQNQDNVKTEEDISKKQQRLAMLRADTSGGNQVAIAQLQKEIADAQQSYGRTLEDQLLDKISMQGDVAARQRQRQIDLMQAQHNIAKNTGTYAAQINQWLSDPAGFRSTIVGILTEEAGVKAMTAEKRAITLAEIDKELTDFTLLPSKIDATTSAIGSLETLIKGDKKSGQKGLASEIGNTIKTGVTNISNKLAIKLFGDPEKKKGDTGALGKIKSSIDGVSTPITNALKTGVENKLLTETTNTSGINTTLTGNFDTKLSEIGDKIQNQQINVEVKIDTKNLTSTTNTTTTATETTPTPTPTPPPSNPPASNPASNPMNEAQIKNIIVSTLKQTGGNTNDVNVARTLNHYGVSESQALAWYREAQLPEIKQQVRSMENQIKTLKGQKTDYERQYTNLMSQIQITHDSSRVNRLRQLANQFFTQAKDAQNQISDLQNQIAKLKKEYGFKTGGLANFTGPAWLDGTPSKPELVLNAKDTQNFLVLRDVLSKVIGSADSITSSYSGNATYEININVDHLNNDYDVDKVAERVKKIIVKDSSYRNVTQVRNFR